MVGVLNIVRKTLFVWVGGMRGNRMAIVLH